MIFYIRTAIFIFIIGLSFKVKAEQDSSFNYIIKSGFAIQLAINDDVSFNDFQGYIFNLKYNFNSRNTLSVGYSIRSNSFREVIISNVGGSLKFLEEKLHYEITSHYIYNFPINKLNIFTGIGPIYGYEFKEVDKFQKQAAQSNFRFTKNNKYYKNNYGISLIFGWEYYLIKNISITTEYDLVLIKSFIKEVDFIYGPSESNEIVFKLNPISFGVSIFF